MRKNRIAAIEQELLQLTPEQHYFGEYYSTYAQAPKDEVKGLSSQKILSLWLEYEQHAQQESKLGLLQKISILFRFNRSALKVFLQTPELVIPYLQRQFYVVRRQELTEERAQLEKKLEQYAFDEKMAELTEKSLRLFRAELSEKFHWQEPRQRFEMRDFRGKSREFNREYPVILSTTYSIKGTLNFEHIYDYLIVDEASQVDLATGVLAFASAKISSLWEISSSFPMCWTAKTSRTARQSGRGILSRRSTISLPTVCSPLPLPHGRRLPPFSCGNTIAAIPRSSISAIRNSTVGSSSS